MELRRSCCRAWAYSAVVAALMVLVAACGEPPEPIVNEPQPDSPLGFYALEFSQTAPPRFSSLSDGASEPVRARVVGGPIADADIIVEATGGSGLFKLGDTVYVHAEFVVTNQTEAPLENLVLLGYHREEFRAGSAVSQPVRVGSGWPVPDRVVRRITPTHTLYYEGSAADPDVALLGAADRSDFVAFEEADLPSLPLPDHAFVTTIFPYGFAFRSLDDPRSRSIAPGAQGQVYAAFAVPAGASHEVNVGSFVWNAVLMATDHVRVTQAVEENHSSGWQAALGRAVSDEADVIVAIGPGTRTTPETACDRVLGITNVRIAGVNPADEEYVTLLPVAGSPEFAGCEGAP